MRKILLVQENSKYQQDLLNVLRKLPKTQILTASDEETAYNILQKENPEVMISDTQLKYSSVDQLVKEFKKRNTEGHTILVKGKDQFQTSQMGMEDNLDKILQNPYHPDHFIFSIKKALNHLSLMDVALDPNETPQENLH
jgi:two-component system, response regulator YesN